MKKIIECAQIALVVIGVVYFVSSCQNVAVIESDTYIRTINGHRYIIAHDPMKGGVSIIHDQSCPAPDSSHIQKVKIVPR